MHALLGITAMLDTGPTLPIQVLLVGHTDATSSAHWRDHLSVCCYGERNEKGHSASLRTMPMKAFLYLVLLQANLPALILSLSLLSKFFFQSLIFSLPLSTNLSFLSTKRQNKQANKITNKKTVSTFRKKINSAPHLTE